MCQAGLIRHIRIGRWIRIPSHTLQEDLHALLDAGQPGSSSHPRLEMERMTHGSHSQARSPPLGGLRVPRRRQAPLDLSSRHAADGRTGRRPPGGRGANRERSSSRRRQPSSEYLEEWLETRVRLQNAPRTYQDYRYYVRRFLQPSLGRFKLTQLRPVHLQGLYVKLRQQGLTRTVDYVHQVIRKALNDAVQLQMVARNPALAARPPRSRSQPVDIPSVELVRAALAVIRGTEVELPIRLAVTTGVRPGELVALRWRDLDLARGRARIRQTLQRIAGEGLVFAPTKTHRSSRTIALDATVVPLLKQHRASQVARRRKLGALYDDHDLVFAQADGRPIEPNVMLQRFQRALQRAGLPPLRIKDLRHVHASIMLSEGVHPRVVQEQLGHASITLTLDTYSHVTPGIQSEAVQRVGKVLDVGGHSGEIA